MPGFKLRTEYYTWMKLFNKNRYVYLGAMFKHNYKKTENNNC